MIYKFLEKKKTIFFCTGSNYFALKSAFFVLKVHFLS